MKTIKLTEAQIQRIFDKPIERFSLSKLNSIFDMEERYEYCLSTLGKPIGKGTARVVFQIGDDEVLKLSLTGRGGDGYEQNKNEVLVYNTYGKKLDIFTKVYQHAKDFSWITTEKVLLLHPEDCIKILGIPYNAYKGSYQDWSFNKSIRDNGLTVGKKKNDILPYDNYPSVDKVEDDGDIKPSVMDFIDWCCEWGRYDDDCGTEETKDDFYFSLMNKNEWFTEVFNFMQQTKGDNDIYYANLGLAQRNGEPYVVILDSGGEELNF